MALYMLKIFDGAGRLIERTHFRARRDEEAAGAVAAVAENRWCELWCGPRMVKVWDGALNVPSSRRRLRYAR